MLSKSRRSIGPSGVRPRRRGVATLEYVLVTASAVVFSVTLFWMFLRYSVALYHFVSSTVGWAFL